MSASATLSQDAPMKARAPRERAYMQARVSYANGAMSSPATVMQISAGGAKLNLSTEFALPEQFDISVPQKGLATRARLVWRKDSVVGVAFIADAAVARPDAEAARSSHATSALEEENAKLRKRVGELTARLALLNDA